MTSDVERIKRLREALGQAGRDFEFLAMLPPHSTIALQNFCDQRVREIQRALNADGSGE
jgi:hypothetical protein